MDWANRHLLLDTRRAGLPMFWAVTSRPRLSP